MPSIPGFEFPPVVIIQVATALAGSGIEASTVAVQVGAPSTLYPILQSASGTVDYPIGQFGDLDQTTKVSGFEGASQDTHITTPSFIELTQGLKLLIFPKDLSRSTFLTAALGTSGTVQKFFDRSPFFFTPSETDPNTLRDISEAEQFMIFTDATIFSFDPFRNTPQSTVIITDPRGAQGELGSGTSGGAHIDTTHPVSSDPPGLDEVPLTISGTDDVIQVDLSAPFFADLSPASGSLNNSERSDLEFSIQDISSPLDQGTIFVWVDGEDVVSAGAVVTSTNFPVGSKTVVAPNDIDYLFQRGPNWEPGFTVTVSGEFADLATVSNFQKQTYQFEIVGSGGLQATILGGLDLTPPVITPTEPASSATQVSANTDIVFSLTDDASGVDPSTVKLFLNGATKIQNDTATGGTFSRVANSSLGFDYVYDSDGQFTFGNTITGTIQASDFSGNTSSVDYEFTVTPDDTLSIENFFLGLDQSALLTTGTLMSVDVIDALYGVASGTTFLTVNGVVPSGLVTVFSGTAASGTCPIQESFLVPLEPLVDFREDLVVVVHAENCFPGSSPVIQEQQFTLRPGYDVDWPNRSEDEEGGPETIFPYVTNIEVLIDVTNLPNTCSFGEASTFFRFLTEDQQRKDLGATIVSNIQTADLPAVVESLNPFFEYGKTMVLELQAKDLEGNTFTITHTFVIETKP